MKRFFDSLQFIEQNLHEKVDIQDMAKASCLSVFHFSRLFKALVGDSPKEYLRKRRMTVAAKKILAGNTDLMDLALQCQFKSQEAFTRAFKAQFDITPGRYRKAGVAMLNLYREPFSQECIDYLQSALLLDPKILDCPGIKTVGIGREFSVASMEEKRQWIPWQERAHEVPNQASNHGFGLYEPIDKENGEFAFHYTCAIAVSNYDDVPKGLICRDIPARQYVRFVHQGSTADLDKALESIWGLSEQTSGMRFREMIFFEVYPEHFDEQGINSLTYVHIPLDS